MKNQWFPHQTYEKLLLTKSRFLDHRQVEKKIEISDENAIHRFMERIERIPVEGDEMISFGPEAESIVLTFSNGKEKQILQLINGKFKTPSTAFHSQYVEEEAALYVDIEALLYPAWNKRLLIIPELELLFDEFSIMYTGQKFRDLAPVSLSFTEDIFLIRDQQNGEQELKITSGQLPPRPAYLKLNGSDYELLLYEKEERLYPYYFKLIKCKC